MTHWLDDGTGLIAAARHLVAQRLSPGSSGNMSVRADEHMIVTPTGSALSRVEIEDLAHVGIADGSTTSTARPSKEWPLHQAAYQADEAIRAVVHLHSPAATALACLGDRRGRDGALPPYTPYHVMSLGEVPVLPYAPPGHERLAAAVGHAMRSGSPVMLLAHHGSVIAAPSLERAVDLAEELEASTALALALDGHDAPTLTQEQRRVLRERARARG